MAGKLTEEQRQEIVRRYEGGESIHQLEKAISRCRRTIRAVLVQAGISLRDMRTSVALAIKAPSAYLDESARQRIALDYVAGKSIDTISKELGYTGGSGWRQVRTIIEEQGVETKRVSRSIDWEAVHEVRLVSAAAISSRYWKPPFPSVSEMALAYGISDDMLRDELLRKGVRLRTKGEQQAIDIKRGIRERPKPQPTGNPRINDFAPKKRSRQHRQRIGESNRRGSFVQCGWCGALIWRKPYRLRASRIAACSLSHSSKYWQFVKKNGPDAPRPIFTERLRELLHAEPFKALPFTRETVEKAAATIGAQEPEVFEVFYEGRQ